MIPLKLDFLRFEFKYVLSIRRRREVEAELQHFLQLDPFVSDSESHKYMVRSLYFDDPHHTAFYDKIDGLKSRSKFRVRTYTSESATSESGASESGTSVPCTPDGGAATTVMGGAGTSSDGLIVPQFIEEKGRHDNRVFKHRAVITHPFTASGACDALARLVEDGPADDVVQRFRYNWHRKQIRPVALVDYLRRPYVSRYDPDLRITFDEQLSATETGHLFPPAWQSPRRLIPGFTVMEVKFRDHLPAWFHRIIQSYELRRVSISKICTGMERLGLAIDLQ
jgi:hypothetical protein